MYPKAEYWSILKKSTVWIMKMVWLDVSGGRLGTGRYIMHRTPQPTVHDVLK